MFIFLKTKTQILFAGFIFLFLPFFISADILNQKTNFFIDSFYDFQGRGQITATLKKVSQRGYFYIEDNWYQNLSDKERERVSQSLENLASEFDNVIYPKLTSVFGEEWKPGIDNDYTITVLFFQMKEEAGGYFNNGDEYPRLQNPKSNEREIIYLNSQALFSSRLNSFLAHEFTHLIIFNRKDRLQGVSEEVWLNEARAESAATLLGYNDEYQGSNLEERVKQFINSPSDSLTEWQNQKADYGTISLFTQYLLEHYGIAILTDFLDSKKIGIDSINEALAKNGFKERFSHIFTDWLIALFLNDCRYGKNYCYKNEGLKNLKIIPSLIFLPSTQKTEVFLNYSIKQWSGNWFRVIGGEGDLELQFDGKDSDDFVIPYILCGNLESCQINFLILDQNKKGKIYVEDFKKNWISLTLIPSVQPKQGFNKEKSFYPFSVFISTKIKTEEEKTREKLVRQIEFLKTEISRIQNQINYLTRKSISCQKIKRNLYFGMRNNSEVRCLQEFLRAQGPEIYPQGLITGNFLSLTREAVIRFQEKYAEEILIPLGLLKGTGYVGPTTRTKINQLLK